MKNGFRTAGGRIRRRLSRLLAMVLLLTVFLSRPGLPAAAETQKGNGGSGTKQWRDITDVIAGEGFTLALREDGRVLYAGDDYDGAGKRIEAWERIERIEMQGWERYLIGYREDGSIRLEMLLDRDYSASVEWSEKDFASWKGVTQLLLAGDYALGLTEKGTVLAQSKDADYAELCREISGWTGICQIANSYGDLVLGRRTDGTVACAAAGEYGLEAKAFWEGKDAPKNIRELLSYSYGIIVLDENRDVVKGISEAGWTNIDSVYSASDSMFGLRRDGTVAVFFGYAKDDPRLKEIAGWDHIVQLGFDITGWARYVPVGLRDDGTICAVTRGYDGEPYGAWNFTGWTDVRKLYSGTDCTFGLRSDGTVLATGGEFGTLDYLDEIARWTDIRAIYLGGGEYTDHVVGLKTDGTLVAAGDNGRGQCEVRG